MYIGGYCGNRIELVRWVQNVQILLLKNEVMCAVLMHLDHQSHAVLEVMDAMANVAPCERLSQRDFAKPGHP